VGGLAHELQPGSRTPWTGVLSFLVALINDFADLSEDHAAAISEFLDRLDDTVATVVEAGGGRTLPSMSHDSPGGPSFKTPRMRSPRVALYAEVEKDRWPDGIRITIGVAIDSGQRHCATAAILRSDRRTWADPPRVRRETVPSQTSADLAEDECRPAACWSKYPITERRGRKDIGSSLMLASDSGC
jgi:hypothetical protein